MKGNFNEITIERCKLVTSNTINWYLNFEIFNNEFKNIYPFLFNYVRSAISKLYFSFHTKAFCSV